MEGGRGERGGEEMKEGLEGVKGGREERGEGEKREKTLLMSKNSNSSFYFVSFIYFEGSEAFYFPLLWWLHNRREGVD